MFLFRLIFLLGVFLPFLGNGQEKVVVGIGIGGGKDILCDVKIKEISNVFDINYKLLETFKGELFFQKRNSGLGIQFFYSKAETSYKRIELLEPNYPVYLDFPSAFKNFIPHLFAFLFLFCES